MTSVRASSTDLLAMAALQRTLAARQGEVAGFRTAQGEDDRRGVQQADTGAVRLPGEETGAVQAAPPGPEAVARAPQGDSAEVSDAAKALRAALLGNDNTSGKAGETDAEGSERNTAAPGQKELTAEEQQEVQKLQARDREVKTHEQAHKAAAGHLSTSGPNYEYVNGPDGRRYANGGEVGISFGEGNTPEETLRNAETAKQAALAPSEPSGQDRKVAAKASQLASQARREIAEEARNPEDDTGVPSTGTESPPGAGNRPGGDADASPPAAALFEPRRAQAVQAYNRVAQGIGANPVPAASESRGAAAEAKPAASAGLSKLDRLA